MIRYVCPGHLDDVLQIIHSEGEAESFNDILATPADHHRFSIYVTQYYNPEGDVVDEYAEDSNIECTYCGRSALDTEIESIADLIGNRQVTLGYSLNAICDHDEMVYPSEEEHSEACNRCTPLANPRTDPNARQTPPRVIPRQSLHSQWSDLLLSEALRT